jgi:phosphatidate cytidylyltransferase
MDNNLMTRIIYGAIFVSVIIIAILIGSYSFVSIFAVICALTLFEFYGHANHQQNIRINKWFASAGGPLLFIINYFYASGLTHLPLLLIYGLYVMVMFIAELYRKQENPVNNWAYFLLGQCMIAVPFALLPYVLFVTKTGANPYILLSVFFIIWVNDSWAYLFGITLGKHRLFERISPKKSWEGFIGGALASLLTGYIYSLFIPQIGMIQWFVMAEIVVVFSTLGDLMESLFKRTIHIKDSGSMIPGHGGLLDRFDSMLLAVPAAYFYLMCLFY